MRSPKLCPICRDQRIEKREKKCVYCRIAEHWQHLFQIEGKSALTKTPTKAHGRQIASQ